MSDHNVKTVVIPAAGLGTRSLPATKVVPKELLPVLDVPAIQLMVEEAVRSGIQRVVLVTSPGKPLVAEHFHRHEELERHLEARGKDALVEKVRAVDRLAEVVTAVQPEPLGLGHAVYCARAQVGDGPFAVLLPDDLVHAETPALLQVIAARDNDDESAVSLMEVPEGKEHLYGIARVDAAGAANTAPLVQELVEKPAPGTAPSRLAIVGRYVFAPAILDALRDVEKGAGGEIQLTDAMALMLKRGNPLRGVTLEGTRFDLGDPAGFVAATVHAGLSRPALHERVKSLVKRVLSEIPEG